MREAVRQEEKDRGGRKFEEGGYNIRREGLLGK